jgi:hypothetical protein
VFAFFGSLFIAFNVFAFTMILQYRKIGRWRDYLVGEKTYMFLSLSAPSGVKWTISRRSDDHAMAGHTSMLQLGMRTAERLSADVSDELRTARLARGLTRQQVAQALGTHRGEYRPSSAARGSR